MIVTVLTPTYNRGYILGQLYNSLVDQTDHDFVWLIVDDGSTDETSELVEKWENENPAFQITYLKKENGGKHRAVNYAVKWIKTEYTFIVDSDDRLTQNAIAFVKKWTMTIEQEEAFAGVAGLRGFDLHHRNGDYPSGIPQGGYIDADNRQRRKYHLTGDKAEVYRTEMFKKFPFPEFEGEKFLSECIVYNQIADNGMKIRWFNEIIYLGNYIADGLTKNLHENRVQCFHGFTEETRSEIKAGGMVRYRMIGRYIQVAKEKGVGIRSVMELLEIKRSELMAGIVWHMLQTLADAIRARR